MTARDYPVFLDDVYIVKGGDNGVPGFCEDVNNGVLCRFNALFILYCIIP